MPGGGAVGQGRHGDSPLRRQAEFKRVGFEFDGIVKAWASTPNHF